MHGWVTSGETINKYVVTRVIVDFFKDFFKEKKIKLMNNFNTVHEIYQRTKRTKEHVVSDQ